MNPDPIGIGDGVNVYAYCRCNPVCYSDRSGTQTTGLPAVGTGNNTINVAGLAKAAAEAAEAKKQAETAKKQTFLKAEQKRIAQEKERQGEIIGEKDPRFYLTKENYQPDQAEIVATKNAAEANPEMKGWIYANYWLGKVGEHGQAVVAGGSVLKGNAAMRLPMREYINGAPVETSGAGTGPIKTYGPGSITQTDPKPKGKAQPLTDPDVTSSNKILLAEKAPEFANKKAAFIHYAKHVKGVIIGKNGKLAVKEGGPDLPIYKNLEEYTKAAQEFFTEKSDNILTKTRQNGDVLRYDKASGLFGVQTKDGVIKTFFKPDEGINYWKQQ